MQKTLIAILTLALIGCSSPLPATSLQPTQAIPTGQIVNPASLKLPSNFPPQIFTDQTFAKSGRGVIVQDSSGNQDIWVSNMDGSTTPIRLTTSPANDYKPAWSPDGTKIAFVSERDNNPEIYVMNADGTAQARLTNNAVKDTFPVWSSDNKLIAFISNRADKAEIYTMNADGTAQTRVTHEGVLELALTWSTDEQLIAYVSMTDGKIYVIKPDGTGRISYIDFAIPDKTVLQYDPEGRNRNCSAFKTQIEAQLFFIAAGGPLSDRHELDSDGGGLACESLP